MKKIRIIALLLACTLVFALLAGCKKEPEQNDEPTPPVVEPIPDDPTPPVNTDPVYPYTNPLTGEGCDTDYSDVRPYAIMLNNLTRALPQYSVGEADIIYEILAEGGITRMMAVFQDLSKVDKIGSIRSARHYYVEMAMGHDAVYLHAGGSPQAYTLINSGAIASVDGVKGGISNDVFYRDQDRIHSAGYEHSMFTTGERITKYVGTASSIRHDHYEGYNYPQTFVEDATPANGKEATLIRAAFTSSKKTSFQYDAATGLYGVYEYGSTYIDGNSNEQVFVKNVLCLLTDVSVIPGDTAGRLNVRTTGEGKGYFACGGKYVEINWSRKDANSPMSYTLADGTPLSLNVGNSYVCVLSKNASVTWTE